MDIINRKIKSIFKTPKQLQNYLGKKQNPKIALQSISKKIESVKTYIEPLKLKLLIVDSDLNIEKLELNYSGETSLNEIIIDIKELMSEMNLKKVELNYQGSKITIE